MIGLLQRVTDASVSINEQTVGNIDKGLLVLVGIEKDDTEKQADRLLERLLSYRVFPDSEDKMNLSLADINGGLLLVPQFTLAADTRKGKRPSFSSAASPEKGQKLFQYLVKQAQIIYSDVAMGRFGADMQVSLANDGPVTFWIEAR